MIRKTSSGRTTIITNTIGTIDSLSSMNISSQDSLTTRSVLDDFTSNVSTSEVDSSFIDYWSYYPVVTFSTLNSVKLQNVVAHLGISSSTILEILSGAGYHIEDRPNTELTYSHLQVLADAFKKSVKQYFKRIKRQLESFEDNTLIEYSKFFSVFIENSEELSPNSIFNQNLDSDLIEKWVFECLSRFGESFSYQDSIKYSESFKRILRTLKYRLPKHFWDQRSKISSTIISHKYHVFPNDDEDTKSLISNMSFSSSSYKTGWKAVKNYYYFNASIHEKYKKTNQTN